MVYMRIEDLANEGSFISSLAGQINTGRAEPLRTSASNRDRPRLASTWYDVGDALLNIPLYRSQAFGLSQVNQSVSSDVGQLITTEGGPDVVLGERARILAPDILIKEGYDDGRLSISTTSGAGANASGGGGSGAVVNGKCFPLQQPYHYSNDWGNARSGGRSHKGTDIMTDFEPHTAANCYAIVDGVIARRVDAGESDNAGNRLLIDGDDGNSYYYLHNHVNLVNEGDRVTAGQVIAKCGSSGNASAGSEHIHFEYHPGGYDYNAGTHQNPYPLLREIELAAEAQGAGSGDVIGGGNGRGGGRGGGAAGDAEEFREFLEAVGRLNRSVISTCPLSDGEWLIYIYRIRRIYAAHGIPWPGKRNIDSPCAGYGKGNRPTSSLPHNQGLQGGGGIPSNPHFNQGLLGGGGIPSNPLIIRD